MLTFLESLLATLCLISVGGYVYGTLAKAFTVRGSRPRYIASTVKIASISGVIVFNIAHYAVRMFAHANDDTVGVSDAIITMLVVVIYVYLLDRELKDDDDNWFSRTRKKLKKFMSNLKSKFAPQPIPIPIPIQPQPRT